jgi:tetratricopeptide (TPR) repeat protein
MASGDDAFALAWQHHQAGDHDAAERGYRDILQREPANARAWFVLGVLYQDRQRAADAVPCFRQATRFQPDDARGHLHLANALLQLGKLGDAREPYLRCLRLQPDHVEALTNLGFILSEEGQWKEAEERYRRAIKVKPELAEAHHNLGNVLREQGKPRDALPCYDRALQLKPDYAKAYINRGVALVSLGQTDEAVRDLRRAVELRPNSADAHNSLGAAVSVTGDLDGAIEEYLEALRLKPDFAEVHWNRALALLLQGKFGEGWPEYEWRWKRKTNEALPAFRQPRWDGAPLGGRTILLHTEQGIGDNLFAVRYAALVKERGGTVVLQCPKWLMPLLAYVPGVDRVVAKSDPLPPFDVQLPMLSLPGVFATTLETIPAPVPYLSADARLVEHWRRELSPFREFRIGIAWQGNPQHPWDRHRSFTLAHLEPLARVPGVRLISLQKGPGSEQMAALADRFPVTELSSRLDEANGSFMDTAAIVRNLDLVVTSDTALAHLAGALAAPVWLALCSTPDWRWLLDRDDSPWYPTMRLFRQPKLGDWPTVFGRMAGELRALVAGRAGRRPIRVEVSAGELLDKITILRIKGARITDADKLRHVREELASLEQTSAESVPDSPELAKLVQELRAVNETLWQIEDDIRECEQANDFGPVFVQLARSVYLTNDRRSALKRRINELLGSHIVEEKRYTSYA